MIFTKPSKLPVIIISGQRTGSSVLLNDMQHQLNLEKMFLEPHSNETYADFISTVKTNNNYIVKFHAYEYEFYQVLKPIIDSNECFLVRIQRKDVVAQCASLYVARMRNFKFRYNNEDLRNSKFINNLDIDLKEISDVVNDIRNRNKILETFPAKFDVDVFYEDLNFSDDLIRTPKPSNYDEIVNEIKKLIT